MELIALFAITLFFLLFILTYLFLQLSKDTPAFSISSPQSPNLFLQKPLIFPALISHTRLKPVHHSFKYSFLLLGTPILYTPQSHWILSVDIGGIRKRGWLSVESRDHLQRGHNDIGLRRKFDLWLESEGKNPNDYPFVYLVTTPRILGHMFNPASFWYLYDSLMVLKAMVAEVNNTFDERIMYFLPNTSYPSSTPSSHCSNSDSPQPHTGVLKHTFKKDMHVSPFSSRRGTYTVESHSPSFHPSQTPNQAFKKASDNPQTIDIKVTLSSSSNHPKLFARLYSTGLPLDPSEQSFFSFWGFMCRWWWVGWCTYPRILQQAIKLAYQKNLSIWYRPEPRSSNVARHATSSEIIFAKTFHHYLLHILSPANLSPPNTESSPSLTLRYTSLTTQLSTHIIPIHYHPPPQFSIPSSSTPQTLKLHILTPSFYSNLLFYPSLQLALEESLFPEREENRLIDSDDGKRACEVLAKFACVEKGERIRKEKWWSLEGVNKHLRKKVNKGKGWYPNPNYPISQILGTSTPQPSIEKDEKREEKKEGLEGENFLSSFVSSHLSEREQREYRKAELTFLLAKLLADCDKGLLKFLGLVVIGALVVGGWRFWSLWR